jgi:hypothetical protein
LFSPRLRVSAVWFWFSRSPDLFSPRLRVSAV